MATRMNFEAVLDRPAPQVGSNLSPWDSRDPPKAPPDPPQWTPRRPRELPSRALFLRVKKQALDMPQKSPREPPPDPPRTPQGPPRTPPGPRSHQKALGSLLSSLVSALFSHGTMVYLVDGVLMCIVAFLLRIEKLFKFFFPAATKSLSAIAEPPL